MGYIEPVHGTERYHDLVPVYQYRFIPVHSGSVPVRSGPVHPGTGQQPGQTVPFRSGTGSFRSGGPIPVRCPALEIINMDFITGLPRSRRQHDSIWVIVDRMTKSAHFLPVKTTHSTEDYAKLYIQEVVRLHGVPVSIISNRGAQFTAQFWKSFHKGLGSKEVASVKVLWRNQFVKEATWEAEEDMKKRYPHLFESGENAGQDAGSTSNASLIQFEHSESVEDHLYEYDTKTNGYKKVKVLDKDVDNRMFCFHQTLACVHKTPSHNVTVANQEYIAAKLNDIRRFIIEGICIEEESSSEESSSEEGGGEGEREGEGEGEGEEDEEEEE
ncbi:hypothetical protein MTR67_025535 [Solanum verrucosum]|uniref:Integrase catalytic domain-containing protein n=1 Tax=Solanum verrucosum TaxID=315347 RepID=A0AAF0R0B9_SOLVR|nr:hypothetical protein MTR67_025535 [Solanum verrucosum]